MVNNRFALTVGLTIYRSRWRTRGHSFTLQHLLTNKSTTTSLQHHAPSIKYPLTSKKTTKTSPPHPLSQYRSPISDTMNSVPLAHYSPAPRILFRRITDDQYAQYVRLYQASKQEYKEKIASVTNMALRNISQGEAGRAEDYYECEAWVQLELKHLHDA